MAQSSTKKAYAKALLNALAAGTAHGNPKPVKMQGFPNMPEALKTLSTNLGKATVKDAKALLKPAKVPCPGEYSLYMSGSTTDLHEIADKTVDDFFTTLFRTLCQRAKPTIKVDLSKWNLFHGHLIYNTDAKKLAFVFHSQEYPKNVPEAGDVQARASNLTADATFKYRNQVWVENTTGTAWILDASDDSDVEANLNEQVDELVPALGEEEGMEIVRKGRQLSPAYLGHVLLDVNFHEKLGEKCLAVAMGKLP